jgi:uncharacterized protein (TIGR02099 family)
MNDPASHPTRLSRPLAALARWSLRLCVAAVLLLALVWAVLHAWIVPRIGDYRILLQQQASQALGIPVQIGAIAIYSRGWLVPSLELRDVQLLDAQQRPALHLPRVLLALSPRSLWRWGFEQLYIEQPALQVRRAADGRLWVAGLLLPDNQSSDSAGMDWLFSQPEVVVQGGSIHWTDEWRGAPPLALHDVSVVLRNGTWRHQLRLDATPTPEWGQRFTLVGRFRQPLLSGHSGHWRQWSGQLFAHFVQVDVARLRHHADVGVQVAQGRGALRAWLDVERGQVVGGVADVALADVQVTTAAGLPPLALPTLQGRLGGRRLPGGLELHTQNLQFTTDDGLRWPGGNLRLRYADAGTGSLADGQLQADELDLAALARIATRLPLPTAIHQALHRYTPEGLVELLDARWQGPPEALHSYQVRAQVRGLALAATAPKAGQTLPPDAPLGLRGATVEVELTQAGGKANLQMNDGALVLPGVFEDPWLPLQQLSSTLRWQLTDQRIAVQVDNTRFANADAQGQLRASWHTSDPGTSGSGARFPGVLDLSGQLSRADGTRVHRYLPLDIPEEARHYVRDTVLAGAASSVDFRVRGDLHDMPFTDPRQGQFHIAARVHGVHYAYVPPRLQTAGELPWPALTGLTGELVFDGSSMRVQGASGSFAGLRQTRLTQVQAHIPDLENAVVTVGAQAKGPLPELLGFLRDSPVQAMLGNALAQTTGSGPAELQLQLQLPIDTLEQSAVQGKVLLAGNDIRITPDSPLLSRARGTVEFTDNSLHLRGIQAKALGGEVRLEGGLPPPPPGQVVDASALQLRAQGTVSAQGLQQAPELGLLAQLAHHASGTAAYSLNLGLRRGVPQLQIESNLQGLALHLPAPLGKASETAVPLRLESHLLASALAPDAPLHEQLSLQWGSLGQVQYVRDISGPQPKVLRGLIALGLSGDETMPLPEQGVAANVRLAQLDTDAWQAVWASLPGATPPANTSAPTHTTTPVTTAGLDYLPQSVALRVGALTVQGRTLHQVVAAASQPAGHWQANIDAQQLGGYAEYHPPGSRQGGSDGLLFARLARLQLPQSSVTSVEETLLEAQPGHLPALDIVVEDFELRQRDLGRLQVQASNRASPGGHNEWRLQQLALQMPEASFSASGNWAVLGAASNAGSAATGPARRTALNFTLDIRDAGQLLSRFGMADVVRRGQGQLAGQVAWRGAPSLPDYPSMTGKIRLDIETGQFLKAEPGLAKLLSVLSLQSLPRRLTLDFRDVFSEGFAFDFVRGDVQIEQGVASTNNLQMKGVNAAVLMEGRADIQHETQDLHVVVVPEINAMSASLVATAINPVVGLGSFLAQMFLRGPLMAAATQEFRIDGSWAEPQVTRLGRESKP